MNWCVWRKRRRQKNCGAFQRICGLLRRLKSAIFGSLKLVCSTNKIVLFQLLFTKDQSLLCKCIFRLLLFILCCVSTFTSARLVLAVVFVCASVSSQYFVKIAPQITHITKMMLHNNYLVTFVFWCHRYRQNWNGVTLNRNIEYRCGRLKPAVFDNYLTLYQKWSHSYKTITDAWLLVDGPLLQPCAATASRGPLPYDCCVGFSYYSYIF